MDYQKEANTMAARVIKADPVIDELCKAMGLESHKVTSIQLDLRYGHVRQYNDCSKYRVRFC
jgi:hypothetical protein